MAAKKRKSWEEKLNPDIEPKVVVVERAYAGVPAGSRVLVPPPYLVQQYLCRVPKGKQVDARGLRAIMAKDFQADTTCPMVMGISLRIIAEAAYDRREAGHPESALAPFWRAISVKSPLAKKLTFGTEWLAKLRAAEGL